MPAPKTPRLAADVIIELRSHSQRPIILIERKYPPYGWAIPGGFVEIGERIETAAIREAWEETGLTVHLLALLGVYSDPQRDPRGHTVTAIYVGEADGIPEARDDAQHVGIFMPDQLPTPLAFDHALVLEDYRHFRATHHVAPLRVN